MHHGDSIRILSRSRIVLWLAFAVAHLRREEFRTFAPSVRTCIVASVISVPLQQVTRLPTYAYVTLNPIRNASRTGRRCEHPPRVITLGSSVQPRSGVDWAPNDDTRFFGQGDVAGIYHGNPCAHHQNHRAAQSIGPWPNHSSLVAIRTETHHVPDGVASVRPG